MNGEEINMEEERKGREGQECVWKQVEDGQGKEEKRKRIVNNVCG